MKRLFWGSGRMDRRLYGTYFAVLVITSWIAHAVGQAAVVGRALPATTIGPAVLLLEAATAWILICISAQRLHDIDRSGWWQLLPLALTCGAFALAEPAWATALGLNEAAAELAGVAGALIYIGFAVAIGVPRGSPGANRFGEAR